MVRRRQKKKKKKKPSPQRRHRERKRERESHLREKECFYNCVGDLWCGIATKFMTFHFFYCYIQVSARCVWMKIIIFFFLLFVEIIVKIFIIKILNV